MCAYKSNNDAIGKDIKWISMIILLRWSSGKVGNNTISHMQPHTLIFIHMHSAARGMKQWTSSGRQTLGWFLAVGPETVWRLTDSRQAPVKKVFKEISEDNKLGLISLNIYNILEYKRGEQMGVFTNLLFA